MTELAESGTSGLWRENAARTFTSEGFVPEKKDPLPFSLGRIVPIGDIGLPKMKQAAN
jgi:hypothetical protein